MKPLALAAALSAVLSAAPFAHADTLDKLKASGAATVGVRESAGVLSYALGDGRYGGFHVEVCQRVLADLQKRLGLPKLDLRYQPVTAQNRIPMVQDGTVDLECGATTNNAARQKQVAFAVTTFVEEVRMAVRTDSGISSIAQLAGKKVAATTGSTSVQHLRKHERAAGVNFEEVFGKDHGESFGLLESGRADAFVIDRQVLAGNIARSKTPAAFTIAGEVLSVEPIAIMLRKDEPAFKAAVDDSIKAMIRSGELARLYDKWFQQPVPPNGLKIGLAASEATRAAWASPNDKPLEDYAKQ